MDKTTRIANDNLIESYHEYDLQVAKAKAAYETGQMILEVRNVQVVKVAKAKEAGK